MSFSEGPGPGPPYKVCGYKASINSVSKLGSFNYKTELKLDCFVTSSKTLNLLKFGKWPQCPSKLEIFIILLQIDSRISSFLFYTSLIYFLLDQNIINRTSTDHIIENCSTISWFCQNILLSPIVEEFTKFFKYTIAF